MRRTVNCTGQLNLDKMVRISINFRSSEQFLNIRYNGIFYPICYFYPLFRFCYAAYSSLKFNGFINCTFWSIIVVITLGKCAHRTPSGFGSATHVLASFKVKFFLRKHLFQSWTSEHWKCVDWISRNFIKLKSRFSFNYEIYNTSR
jgi:hypothetical protein